MPAGSPRKIKTIDGIKRGFATRLRNRYKKNCLVEVSYRYEKIPRVYEWKWSWECFGNVIADIVEDLIGENPSIREPSPKERIYCIRYCLSREKSAYKESDWIEAFEGTKQELFDWWEENYAEPDENV